MIGLVVAAGAGRRLRPHTDRLPKTLIPVDGETTILDLILRNLATVGLTDVAIIAGYAANAIAERVPALEDRHGVRLEIILNDRAEEWNNAYSVWLARHHLGDGALLVNGDTVHPVSVEKALLAHPPADGPGIVLAVDHLKRLGEEEMKVSLDGAGRLRRITKAMPPSDAFGEYIGATLIEPGAAPPLAEALEATWRRDPGLYYEDGYAELAARGGHVRVATIGSVEWVEVDSPADLARAREIACRC